MAMAMIEEPLSLGKAKKTLTYQEIVPTIYDLDLSPELNREWIIIAINVLRIISECSLKFLDLLSHQAKERMVLYLEFEGWTQLHAVKKG